MSQVTFSLKIDGATSVAQSNAATSVPATDAPHQKVKVSRQITRNNRNGQPFTLLIFSPALEHGEIPITNSDRPKEKLSFAPGKISSFLLPQDKSVEDLLEQEVHVGFAYRTVNGVASLLAEFIKMA